MPRDDNVRDAMRDDPGLAAACAREDQKWSFGMRNGFTLLGIQPFEKVHAREDTSDFTMSARDARRRNLRRKRSGALPNRVE